MKAIPSTTFKYLVHRKCSQLKISEITGVLKTKENIEIWEFPFLEKANFPFCDLENVTIEKEVFNSIFGASVHVTEILQLKQENLHSNINQVKKMEIRQQNYQKVMSF